MATGIAFLMEQERAYCGASALFAKLQALGINPYLYMLPPHYIFQAEELSYYAQSILNDLRGKPDCEDRNYVKTICESLKEWAERGYIVHCIY